MTTYESRTTSMTVAPKDEPIFSEQATMVTIVDDATGEYVEVCQSGREDLSKIAINPEEWPALRKAINSLILQCRNAT